MYAIRSYYGSLAGRCDYPLHLGLTEAGMGSKGIVSSTAAMSVLLQEGIGDTIRVSLTPEPEQARTDEVIVAQEILQTMGLRAFTPMVTACPGCGRTTSTTGGSVANAILMNMKDVPQKRARRMNAAQTFCCCVIRINQKKSRWRYGIVYLRIMYAIRSYYDRGV